MSFTLHAQLAADTLPIGDLPLCRALLMNNAHFPWIILVPRIEDAVELTDLSDADYTAVTAEIRQVAQAMQRLFQPYKLNIAALGNQVRQLHIHLIVRFEGDAAWPNPVWSGPRTPYPPAEAENLITHLALSTI